MNRSLLCRSADSRDHPAHLVQHGQVDLVDGLVAGNRDSPVAGHSSGARLGGDLPSA